MKHAGIWATLLAMGTVAAACDDEETGAGNPVMNVTGNLEQAYFGDSLTFTVKATDNEVPLSTIHAELYFGDEMVSEKVIRTKVSGADYVAKMLVPYYANIPDGRATLRLTLQNINFTTVEQIYQVPISHPDYPSLTFRTEDGEEYAMEKTGENEYAVTGSFAAEMRGVIVAPPYGPNGNEIVFGYEDSAIRPGGEGAIPFSNSTPGRYTISFNTFSFEGSPFIVLSFNGNVFEADGETTSFVDMNLSQGERIVPDGFPNFADWWVNPDYFEKNDDGSLTFTARGGAYHIIADSRWQYFRVYKTDGGEPATLNDDGTGALWVIGEGVGHPSLSNAVGWTTENAICMAPVAEKKYQLTLVGGKTVSTDNINFKFYGTMGWDKELKGTADLTSQSDLVGVGTGDGGHDDGNLYLKTGKSLQANGVYVFTVDFSQGRHEAVLTVEYKGEQAFEEKPVYLNGQKMTTSDNVLYTTAIDLTQGSKLGFSGFTGLDALYYDPDYFLFDGEAFDVTFLPVDGRYAVTLDKANGTLSAKRVNADGSDMTLQDDGSGALWLMAWGLGSPSMDFQFGFDPGKAYCMAEVRPGVYQFTGKAGPEKGSSTGDRFRVDYLSFKFFHQNGWGGEFKADAFSMTDGTEELLKGDDNFELADGVTLEQGATYRLTVDLSAGKDNGTISMVKM